MPSGVRPVDERVLTWLAWLFQHKGTVAGVVLGIGFGWLSIRFGVLRAMFVLLCMVGGLAVGYRYDSGKSWAELLDQVLPSDRSRFR